MDTNTPHAVTFTLPLSFYHVPVDFVAWRKPANGTSQAKRRRDIRRRSNLPKAIQKRLGFKCH